MYLCIFVQVVHTYVHVSVFFLLFFPRLPPQYARCGGYIAVRAWKEALLAAIVPDAEKPGANVLQLFSPEGVIGGHEDECLCSVGLPAEQHQTAGNGFML